MGETPSEGAARREHVMTTDSTFRAIILANVGLCLPNIYYRIKSQATGEKLDRSQEGIAILVGLRLCGALAAVALATYLAAPAWISWATLPLPNWLRWAGAGLGLFVVPPLWTWTFHSLGKNLTDTVVTRKEHTLVTRGPYQWVRHPFYDVGFLEALALALLSANGLLAVLFLAVMTILVVRTKVEEAKLIERFGKAYEDYAARTGRFVPLLGRRSRGAER
jgi:protein-S-isoprenylcysteine O-methyltransferase Ste14